MIELEQIGRKYEKSKKVIENVRLSLKEKIKQQIETESINALKIQNHKVSQIHKNQHQIQVRLKRNNEIKFEMEKQLSQWSNMYEDLNKSLKKAGDLAHYANFIEDEVSRICFETNPNNQGLTFISKLENFDD